MATSRTLRGAITQGSDQLYPQYRGGWEPVPYELADIVRYNNALYVAESYTGSNDVPGISSVWKSVIDDGGLIKEAQDKLPQLTQALVIASNTTNDLKNTQETIIKQNLDMLATTATVTNEVRSLVGIYSLGREPKAGDLAGTYRWVDTSGNVVDIAWNGDAETGRTTALATKAMADTAQNEAANARQALGNTTLASLALRSQEDGPQFVDGSRWMWAANSPLQGGDTNGGTVVTGADGVWVREANAQVAQASWFGINPGDTIDNALTAAAQAGYLTFELGPGVYRYNNLVQPLRMVIKGQGSQVTTIKANSASSTWTWGGLDQSSYGGGWTGFRIEGPGGVNKPADGSFGPKVLNINQASVSDVKIIWFETAGAWYGTGPGGSFYSVFNGFQTQNCRHGMLYGGEGKPTEDSQYSFNGNTFIGSNFSESLTAFTMNSAGQNVAGNVFIGCDFSVPIRTRSMNPGQNSYVQCRWEYINNNGGASWVDMDGVRRTNIPNDQHFIGCSFSEDTDAQQLFGQYQGGNGPGTLMGYLRHISGYPKHLLPGYLNIYGGGRSGLKLNNDGGSKAALLTTGGSDNYLFQMFRANRADLNGDPDIQEQLLNFSYTKFSLFPGAGKRRNNDPDTGWGPTYNLRVGLDVLYRDTVGVWRHAEAPDYLSSPVDKQGTPLSYHKVTAQAVPAAGVTVAHGLGVVPQQVALTARGNANVWYSSVDASNITVHASTPVDVEILIG